jgi:hypothetical protein
MNEDIASMAKKIQTLKQEQVDLTMAMSKLARVPQKQPWWFLRSFMHPKDPSCSRHQKWLHTQACPPRKEVLSACWKLLPAILLAFTLTQRQARPLVITSNMPTTPPFAEDMPEYAAISGACCTKDPWDA